MRKILLSALLAVSVFGTSFGTPTQAANNSNEAAVGIVSSDPYLEKVTEINNLANGRAMMEYSIVEVWKAMNVPLTDYNAAAEAVVSDIWYDLMGIYAAEYRRQGFTSEDLDNIIAFYSTPSGSKVARYTESIAQNVQKSMMSRFGGRMERALLPYVRK